MAAVDPNVYALSVQLQLDTALANVALDEMLNTLKEFGDSVNKSSKDALNTTLSLAAQLDGATSASASSLSQIGNASNTVAAANSQLVESSAIIESSNSASLAAAQQMANSLESQAKSASSISRAYDATVGSLNKALSSSIEFIKVKAQNYASWLKERDETLKHQAAVKDFMKDVEIKQEAIQKLRERGIDTSMMEQQLTKQIESNIGKISGAVKGKNVEHGKENDLVAKEKDLLGQVFDIWGQISSAVSSVIRYFSEIDKGTENFVTANYRMYGTQQQLLNSTRALNAELGITPDKAIDVIKSLADVGTPIEDMDKLGRSVGIATRTMGLSGSQMADFVRRMRSIGMNAEGISKNIERMTGAMRKYGLATQDITGLISRQESAMIGLRQQFGEGAIADLTELEMSLMGSAKSFGYSTSAVNEFFTTLSDPKAMMKFQAMTGVLIKTPADMKKALNVAGEQLADFQKRIEEAAAAGEDTKVLQAEMDAISQAMGMNSSMAQITAKRYNKLAEEAARTGRTIDDVTNDLEFMAKLEKEELAVANDTLIGQLNILAGYIGAIGIVLQYLADCVRDAVKMLNYLIYGISQTVYWIYSWIPWTIDLINWVVKAVVEFFGWTESLRQFGAMIYKYVGPALGYLATFLRGLIGIAIIVGFVFLTMSSGALAFAGSLLTVGTATTTFASIIAGIGARLAALGSAISSAVVGFFTMVGNALRALGMAIRPVIVPLMGLGVALLLVAVAALVFAYAVQIIASVGAPAIDILWTMALTLGLLIAVLVGLAIVAAPAAPVILAIAGALALAGLAALLVGLAFYFVALAFVMINEAVNAGLATNLMILAPALAWFGLSAAIAAIGVALLAVAMMALGYSSIIVATAVLILAIAFALLISYFGPEKLEEIANGFKKFVEILAPVILQLIGIAIGLAVAGVLLLVAGILIAIGGLLLAIGAAFLWLAGNAIAEFAKALKDVDVVTVAFNLAKAAGWLILAGAGIIIGGVLLIIAAVVMVYASIFIGIAGIALIIGAFIFGVGAMLLAGAAFVLQLAISVLQPEADKMPDLGTKVLNFGVDLFVGGIGMAIGAFAMIIAGILMIAAGLSLGLGAAALRLGLWPLSVAAEEVQRQGIMFGIGGTMMKVGMEGVQAAANMLREVGATLRSGVPDLKAGLTELKPAAEELAVAGMLLYQGGLGLLYGTIMVSLAVAQLDTILGQFFIVSVGFAIVSTIMLIGAFMLLSATTTMLMSLDMLIIFGQMAMPALYGLYFFVDGLSMIVGPLMRAAFSLYRSSLAILVSSVYMTAAFINLSVISPIADAISDSVERMVTALAQLTDINAIAAALSSVNLTSPFDQIASQLDAYATKVEQVSERVWAAVNSKAVPAMKAAENAGITEAIRSEAIQTVRVTQEDAGVRVNTAENENAQKIINALTGLKDAVEKIVPDGGTALDDMLNLLEAYLPKIARKDGGLSTEFNAWAK